MTRQLILDTETTGLETKFNHRIIELAIVEIVNRKLTGRYFHTFFNPERDIDPGAQAVHGIQLSSLMDKPKFVEKIHDILEFVKGSEVIIHNAKFDVGFLNYEIQLAGVVDGEFTHYCQITDTLELARRLYPNQKNNLDALCKRLKIDNSQRTWHGALLDCELLAKVYLAMTGGQVEMFANEDDSMELNQASSSGTPQNQVALTSTPMVQLKKQLANELELQAHQQFLETLRKRGQCLWDNIHE